MSAQFSNMNEMIAYLEGLEHRIETLEEENQQLKLALSVHQAAPIIDEKAIARSVTQAVSQSVQQQVTQSLPTTGLLSRNFLTRSFTAWGHAFFAQLVFSVILLAVYVAIAVAFFGLSLGSLTGAQ